MDTDRDALFAALALETGRIDGELLSRAARARSKSTLPLAELMAARGWIGAEDRDALLARADVLLRAHPGNPLAAWSAVADARVRDQVARLGLGPVEATDAFTPTIDGQTDREAETVATIDGPPGATSAAIDAGSGSLGPPADRGSATIASLGIGPDRTAATIASLGGPPDRTAATIAAGDVPADSRFVDLERLDEGRGDSRYTRTHLHAQGGIGRIWRARDARIGREVALKELRPERSGSGVLGRPVRHRGADHRPARAPEHRAGPRARPPPRGRPAVLHDAVRPRPDARRGDPRLPRGPRRRPRRARWTCGRCSTPSSTSATRSPSPTPAGSSTAT